MALGDEIPADLRGPPVDRRDRGVAEVLLDATAEVERYIAIPSQAVAYKIGALTIQRLRDKSEKELGEKFDIREFHDTLLANGAVPLNVLKELVQDWVDGKI